VEIRDDHGLRAALPAVDEALDELWRSTESVDVVRIPAPAAASPAALARRGYVRNPGELDGCGQRDADRLGLLRRGSGYRVGPRRPRIAKLMRRPAPAVVVPGVTLWTGRLVTVPHDLSHSRAVQPWS
jgi:hypothetical protein